MQQPAGALHGCIPLPSTAATEVSPARACSSGAHCRPTLPCSLYWTLATFVWWTYAAKLVPQLRLADNAQHFVMGAGVVGMAALST